MNLPPRGVGQAFVVRNDDDGRSVGIEPLEEGDDLSASVSVELAGWLVGENKSWTIRQCARYCHTLLLPARELGRTMTLAVAQADVAKELRRPLSSLLAWHFCLRHRQRDVLECRQNRHQIEALKDEPDVVQPK